MWYNLIGNFIKKLRIQQGMSQETLAYGIITQANLSKLENGKLMPSKEKLEAILQRLGVDTRDDFCYYLNEDDYEKSKKCDYLQSLIKNNKNSDANILIDELKELDEFKDGINKQFLSTCKATVMLNLEQDNKEIRRLVDEALKITLTTYSIDNIPNYCLSYQEVILFNILSITYSNEKNYEEAIRILEKLKENLDSSKIDQLQKSKLYLYPHILYNLSNYYGLSKKYLEAINICNYAREICIETNNFKELPNIIYNKAYCLLELGHKEECEDFIYQVYYMMKGMGNDREKEIVKNYALNHMGIVIYEK